MIVRQLAKDSVIYGGADLITKVIAFFTFPIIATVLSPAAFGVLELVTTVSTLLGLFVGCGLNNAAQRFYWDETTREDERPLVVSAGLFSQIIFGLIILVACSPLLFLFYPFIEARQLPISLIGLFFALGLMLFTQWSQFILDTLRLHFAPWRFLSLSVLLRVLSSILAVIAVIYWGAGIDGLLGAQFVVLAFLFPISLAMIKKDLTLPIDWSWAKQTITYGYPFIFVGLAFWIFGAIDRWMLAGMTSVEEVGVYSVAFRFASVVLFLSVAFGQAWSPLAIKLKSENHDTYRATYGNVLLVLLYVMLIGGGGVALFAGEIIGLIMSEAYTASALPLAILCFGIVLQSSQQITAMGISLEKKTHLFAKISWVTALCNAALNYVLIPKFGATGAAFATLFSYFILTASYLYYTQVLHPLVINWTRLNLLLCLGTVVGIVSVLYISVDLQVDIILWKLALAVVCILIGWRLLPLRDIKYS